MILKEQKLVVEEAGERKVWLLGQEGHIAAVVLLDMAVDSAVVVAKYSILLASRPFFFPYRASSAFAPAL